MLKPALAALLVAAILTPVVLVQTDRSVEWPHYGGDPGGTKYSPLDEVNRGNVSRLRVAWEWKTGEKALADFRTRPGNFQATPLMIGSILYLSTPYNRVVALNAETGGEMWAFDPKAYEDGQPPNGTGFVHRGVAAWRDRAARNALRIFINSRYRLICLDAATGKLVDVRRPTGWSISAAGSSGKSTRRTTRTRRRRSSTRIS